MMRCHYKNPKVLFSIIFILLTGTLIGQSESEIILETTTGQIFGTLGVPDVNSEVPIVLIIAGSGPTDRNGNNPMMSNNSLKMLSDSLLANKIATLRYDKRGIAKSASAMSSESELRFQDYFSDAEAWITLIRQDDRFNKIFIIGHSEGSLLGMIAAKNSKADGFISLAGPGNKAGDIIRMQLEAQSPFLKNVATPFIDSLESGVLCDSVPILLNSLFRKSVQPYLISWFQYDPSVEIKKLNCPILIIQGTTDIQVNVEEAEILKAAQSTAQIEIIDGMNHILKPAEAERMKNISTYSDPDLALHEGLIPPIVQFILNNSK